MTSPPEPPDPPRRGDTPADAGEPSRRTPPPANARARPDNRPSIHVRHAARLLAEGHDPDAVAALTRVPRALLDLDAPLTGSPARPAPALPAMPVPTTANRLEDHQTVLLIALRRVQRRRRAALAVGIGFGLNAGLALGAATSGQPQVAAASLLTTPILMALLWPCVRPTSCMAAGRTPRKRRGLLQS